MTMTPATMKIMPMTRRAIVGKAARGILAISLVGIFFFILLTLGGEGGGIFPVLIQIISRSSLIMLFVIVVNVVIVFVEPTTKL